MPTNISNEQQEILDLLTINYLTPKQISTRRQTSIQAVYKTINKLKKKGYLIGGLIKGFENRGVEKSDRQNRGFKNTQKIRLHNVQESIKIIEASKTFYKRLQKSNKIEYKGLTVMIYKDNIQIFTQEGISFYGETTNEAYQSAILFFKKFYIKLENDLNIIIDKDRTLNKKWVRQHIALTHSDIAKRHNEEEKQLIIKDKEDGKQRIITDNSFKLDELEGIHPTKAKADMDNIKYFVDDIINNNPLNNSQLSSRINEGIRWSEENTKSITELKETLFKLMEIILKK